MAKAKQYPAAFINALSDPDYSKDDVLQHLQQTWNSHMALQTALIGLGFTKTQINVMCRDGKLGKVF